jgi:hypothetical protein
MALKPSSRLRNYAPELAQAESAESSGIALEDAPENDPAPEVMLRPEAGTGAASQPVVHVRAASPSGVRI